MKHVLGLLLWVFLASCSSTPKLSIKDLNLPSTSLTPDQWALEKLKKNEVKIKIPLEFQKTNTLTQQIIKLNVLGFLYQPDYSKQDTPEAIDTCRKFLKKNRKALAVAEAQYGVPKEVITALLWVETRFGKKTGGFSVTNVFYQLSKADHPDLIQLSLEELLKKRPDADFTLQKKVVDRSTTKSQWAMDQLKALEKIKIASKLKSSYAGAFGMAQFIPSSYLKYAVSPVKGKSPDLYHVNDVVYSVGNFLAMSGWKQDVKESHAAALYEYNRSKDYGAIILQLASKL